MMLKNKNNLMIRFIRSMVRPMKHAVLVFVILLPATVLLPVSAATEKTRSETGKKDGTVSVSNTTLSFKMVPRTPDQMAAFYEGRGFPAKVTSVFNEVCFFTVIVKNLSRDIVWLEPASWQIKRESGANIKRLGQQYWRQRWSQLDLPKNNQATFRWTLLPTSRDLRPDEGVGGNLVLAATSGNIMVTPVFRLGAEGQSRLKLATQTIRCGGR
ncbi:MAG: hypothetical protein ACC635_00160 [Acidiferrobacterales bacterium]